VLAGVPEDMGAYWEGTALVPYRYIFLIQLYIVSAVPPPAGILHVASQRTSDMHTFRQSGAREAQQEFDRELKLGPNRPSFGTCFT
jgi:hypothetical protein